jgi:hypothetical protein
VTHDRVVLIAVGSTYIFVGSALKDGRLLHFMGDTCRDYQPRVPGYPGAAFGPLGRIRPSIIVSPDAIEPARR